jgi:alpha-tubulin suppressor-like RCC1 family protein
VTAGNGSIAAANVQTDANGIAAPGAWTLGPKVGTNTLTASASGLPTATFTAHSVAGPATKMSLLTAPSATAGARVAFATQPAVQLLDANDNAAPQQGVVVTAAITAGGGTLGGTTTATTDQTGAATFTNLSIGGSAGARTLSFSATGISSTTADVTIQAGAASSVAINAGNNQNATAGSAVTIAPSVVVSDADGNVVSGATVTFAVASGGGSVTGASAITGSNGVATVGSWTLGATAGANTLTATSGTLPAVRFTATGLSGNASALAKVGADPASVTAGASFGDSIRVRATDANGNPKAGVAVTFAVTAGGGSVAPATATTDAAGLAAAVFTTGTSAGTNTATASATGLAGSPVTWSITTTAGPAAAVTKIGTYPAIVVAGASYGDSVRAQVTDANGNPKSGITVTFAVTAGGGTIAPASRVTDSAGKAAARFVTGPAAGSNSATATVSGLAPATFTITTSAPPVNSVSVTPDSSGMPIGSTQPLTATMRDASNNVLSGRSVAWQSSNPGVATVSSSGLVTAVALGTTTITATSEGKSAQASLAVEALQQVRTGSGYSCGLTTSGAAYCWGSNTEGALGIGTFGCFCDTTKFAKVPVAVSGGLRFKSISLGGGSVIALTSDGTAYSWGRNNHGQLGVGDSVNKNVPTPVATALKFSYVDAGQGEHMMGLTSDGTAYAWGFNPQGGLGDGTVGTPRVTPVPVAGGLHFKAISPGGSNFTIAIGTDGKTYGWGVNDVGELGDSTFTARYLSPVEVAKGYSFASVYAASSHVLALTAAGELYTWGDNFCGALGDGTDGGVRRYAKQVTGLPTIRMVSGGSWSSVALDINGTAYAWGLNNSGQAGNGTASPNNTCGDGSNPVVPTAVLGGHTFMNIAAGGTHVYALKSDGSAWAWGHNTLGELGDGTATNRSTPVLVVGGLILK